MFDIRERTEDDLGVCGDIVRETREHDGYPAYLPGDPVDFLRHGHELDAWVATSADSVVVGHVALHAAVHDPARSVAASATGLEPANLALVSRLFVHRSARRVGVGAALLAHATDAASAQGLQPVLDVVKTLAPAITMYERCGWTRAGELTYRWDTGAVESWLYVGPAPARPV